MLDPRTQGRGLGLAAGTFYIFAAAREKQVLATVSLDRPISSTATAANGVLYVATLDRLYALRQGARPDKP